MKTSKCIICRKEIDNSIVDGSKGIKFQSNYWSEIHIVLDCASVFCKQEICMHCLIDLKEKKILQRICDDTKFQEEVLRLVRKWIIAGRI